MLLLLLLLLQAALLLAGASSAAVTDRTADATVCGGEGDPSADWLVTPCGIPASFSRPTPASFVLRNGIVKRTLTVDPATNALATTGLISEVTGVDKLASGSSPPPPPLAEAELSINGVNVAVGGPNATVLAPGTVQLTFSGGVRHSAETIAGNFSFTPGSRGTRKDRSWPPKGVHAEFDHVGPCAALNAGPSGTVTVTLVYELYQGISAFSKRLLLSHSCEQELFVFNMSVHLAPHRNTRTGIVEMIADGQPGMFLKGTALSGDGSNINAAAYEAVAQDLALDSRYGPGLSHFAAGATFASFLVLELIHDANGPEPGVSEAAGGAGRFLLETSAAQRTVSPQVEQFPIQMEAVCAGGVDGSSGTGGAAAGMWCYDSKGTEGIYELIDQVSEGAETYAFFEPLLHVLKTIILPRQAWDNHMKSSRDSNKAEKPRLISISVGHPNPNLLGALKRFFDHRKRF
eukprot:COSAG06_NODE_413_length_16040_cov_8.901386_6_plen_461_part_00